MTIPAGPRRAADYERISRADRDAAGELSALGVERQRKDNRRLIEEKGWTPVGSYTDNDLTGARKSDGTLAALPDRDRLLADVRLGLVDVIVVWSLDRLTRDPHDFELITLAMQRYGVAVVDHYGRPIELDADGLLMARIQMAMHAHYAQKNGERRRAANDQRADSGIPFPGRRPFGRNHDRSPHDVEAPHLAAAVHAVVAGIGCHGIATRWNNAGITTVAGSRWSSTLVKMVITNPVVVGDFVHRGAVVRRDVFAPIVERPVWEAACGILNDPARTTTKYGNLRRHLLSGILLCSCGASLRWMSKNGRGAYCCHKQSGGCGGTRRSAAKVDNAIERLMVRYLTDLEFAPAQAAEPDRVEIGIGEANRRIEATRALVTAGQMEPEDAAPILKGLRATLDDLRQQRKTKTRGVTLEGFTGAEGAKRWLNHPDINVRRTVLLAAMNHVLVLPTPADAPAGVFHPDLLVPDWIAQDGQTPRPAPPARGPIRPRRVSAQARRESAPA